MIKKARKPKNKAGQGIFRIQFLTEDRVDEATKLASECFVKKNTIWVKLGVTYEDAFPVNKVRTMKGLIGKWSFVYLEPKTKEVVLVHVSVDLYDYLNDKGGMPNPPYWIKFLKSWGAKMEDDIWQKMPPVKRGDYLYGDIAAIAERYANSGQAFKFYATTMLYYKQAGFIGYYTRTTHIASTRLMEQMGGKVVKRIFIEDPKYPEMKGQFMDFIYLEFATLACPTIEQIIEAKDENDEVF